MVTLAPILFSDIVVMIPMTMAFLFAGGPVLAYAKETPTCRACGLARPHPGWHETPCRPVRELELVRTALRLQAHDECLSDEPGDEPSGVRPMPKVEPSTS